MPFDPSPFADISPLTLRVPLGIREASTSLCSRLAAWNGRSMAAFCTDMRIAVRNLMNGGADALAKLAALGGIDLAELTRSAIRSPDPTQVVIGSERLTPSNMRRRWTRVCPACLAEDIAGRPDLGEAAPYGRTAWLVEAVRTCPVHRLALARFDNPECHDVVDFTAWIRPGTGHLEELAVSLPARDPSRLETYLLSRLSGRPSDLPVAWLADMPLHVMISISEILGALDAGAGERNLTDDERRTAGEVGFDAISGGPDGIVQALDRQVRSVRIGAGSFDATSVYGRLHAHLTLTAADPDYDPVRRIVRDHLLATLPVGADDVVFGEPVGRRRLHSIATAANETRAHPWLVRRLLAQAGLLPADDGRHAYDRVTFPAERAAPVLDRASERMRHLSAARARDVPRVAPPRDPWEGLSFPAAAAYANMSRRQLLTVCGADLVKPTGNGRGRKRFRKIEKGSLHRLLKHLREHAVALDDLLAWGMTDIPTAARLAGCSVPRLLGLALEGAVTSLSCPTEFGGYMSLRLDPGEVRRLVAAQSELMTVHDVGQRLQVGDDAVRGLSTTGYLRSVESSFPGTGIRQTLFAEEVVGEFDDTFVALAPLAASRGLHVGSLLSELAGMGIEPAFNPRFVGAIFYRRADLPA